jgi:hypothetical protein
MALAIFTRTCAKNVAGASKVFIAESSVITAITVTTGEISAVTGTTPFMRVDADQDSIQWDQKVEQVGNNNVKVTNTIDFKISGPSTATNTFIQALLDGSPCGLFAIIIDGNGKCWLVGYNTVDLKNRPLRVKLADHKTGANPSDADGQVIAVQLGHEAGGIALPFDTTNTGTIVGGTNTMIKWT